MTIQFMTPAQYGRYRGVTRQAVDQALKRGVIEKAADGRIEVEIADAAWPLAEAEAPAVQAPAKGGKALPSIGASRRYEAALKAKRLAIEVARIEGSLIEIAAVKSAWLEILGKVRASLLGLPTELALRIAEEKDAKRCQKIMADRIDQILTALAAGLASGGGQAVDGVPNTQA